MGMVNAILLPSGKVIFTRWHCKGPGRTPGPSHFVIATDSGVRLFRLNIHIGPPLMYCFFQNFVSGGTRTCGIVLQTATYAHAVWRMQEIVAFRQRRLFQRIQQFGDLGRQVLGAHPFEQFLLPGMGEQHRAGGGHDDADQQDQKQAPVHGTENCEHLIRLSLQWPPAYSLRCAVS